MTTVLQEAKAARELRLVSMRITIKGRRRKGWYARLMAWMTSKSR